MKRATFGKHLHFDVSDDFNPRPREEGDFVHLSSKIPLLISIHALVKRATNNFEYPNIYQIDFNPRPREEGDVKMTDTIAEYRQFQSTPS